LYWLTTNRRFTGQKLHVDSELGKHFVDFSDSRSCFILRHFTHLENNTCVVIHHALKRLSDRMDNLKGRD